MATVTHEHTLKLSTDEVAVLRSVLGSLNDIQLREICNIDVNDRELLRDIWDLLCACTPDC